MSKYEMLLNFADNIEKLGQNSAERIREYVERSSLRRGLKQVHVNPNVGGAGTINRKGPTL